MNKGYMKDGYFYERGRVVCGICCSDLGPSKNPKGELSYDGCEEENFYE